LFQGWMVVFKRLDHGSSHPTKPLRALARTPTARDDTVDSLLDLFQLTIPPSNICANLREPPFQLQISCWSCRSSYPRSIILFTISEKERKQYSITFTK